MRKWFQNRVYNWICHDLSIRYILSITSFTGALNSIVSFFKQYLTENPEPVIDILMFATLLFVAHMLLTTMIFGFLDQSQQMIISWHKKRHTAVYRRYEDRQRLLKDLKAADMGYLYRQQHGHHV